MKIIYDNEGSGLGTALAVIGAVMILVIPIDMIFNSFRLLAGYPFFLVAAALMGVGVWFVRRSAKAAAAEREYLIKNGFECRGEVVQCMRRRESDEKYHTILRIRYHSRILDREITFDTSRVNMHFRRVEGAGCTVYEAPATEEKKRSIANIQGVFGISGSIEGSDPDFEPDELSYIADSLENAETENETVKNIVQWTLIAGFFVLAGYVILKSGGTI